MLCWLLIVRYLLNPIAPPQERSQERIDVALVSPASEADEPILIKGNRFPASEVVRVHVEEARHDCSVGLALHVNFLTQTHSRSRGLPVLAGLLEFLLTHHHQHQNVSLVDAVIAQALLPEIAPSFIVGTDSREAV